MKIRQYKKLCLNIYFFKAYPPPSPSLSPLKCCCLGYPRAPKLLREAQRGDLRGLGGEGRGSPFLWWMRDAEFTGSTKILSWTLCSGAEGGMG